MKFIPRLVAISLIFLCAGCAGASSESSYEDSVSEACQEVLLGLDLQGLDVTTTTADFHFRKASTQFRNLSNQNQAFTDYAEVLNGWKTDVEGKINEVYNFCGIDPTPTPGA